MTDFVKCSDALKEKIANILWLEREIGLARKGLSQEKVIYYHNDVGQHLRSTYLMPTAKHCYTNVTYTNYCSQPRRSNSTISFPLYFRLSTERLSNLPRITRLISSRASQVLSS